MAPQTGYRVRYVFIAIGLVVAVAIVASVSDPTGKTALPVVLVSVGLLLVFILAYQWRTVGHPKAPVPDPLSSAAKKDPGTITDPAQMIDLLALRPVTQEERDSTTAGQGSLARISIGLGAIVGGLGFTFTVLLETRVIDPNSLGNGEWTRFAPIVLLPFAMLYVRYMMGRAASSSNQMLDPLGLTLTAMPQVGVRPRGFQDGMQADARGPTVLEGNRHGRTVRIEFDRSHVTTVIVKAPTFEISRDGDRLVAEHGAPAQVRELVDGLGPSAHWKKLKKISGGPEGIVAERKVDTENGWMWDLWLAERLADAVTAKP